MFKKIVIAGLVMALLIEKLKKRPKMLISEVDAMLYRFNLLPEDRIMFKSVLVQKKNHGRTLYRTGKSMAQSSKKELY